MYSKGVLIPPLCTVTCNARRAGAAEAQGRLFIFIISIGGCSTLLPRKVGFLRVGVYSSAKFLHVESHARVGLRSEIGGT